MQRRAHDFSLGEVKTEGPKIEAEDRKWSEVLGEGQQAPPHQLGGLGERCELPSGVLG